MREGTKPKKILQQREKRKRKIDWEDYIGQIMIRKR